MARRATSSEPVTRSRSPGSCVFAIAMTCAIALVTHYLFGAATAIVTTALAVLAFSMVWFVLPLLRRRAAARRDRLH